MTSNQASYWQAYRDRVGREELNRRARARYDPAKEKAWRDARGRTREDIFRYGLKFAHKMTPDQWEALWRAQDGLCYLCEMPMTRPEPGRGTARGTDVVIEHDHGCCQAGRSCEKCRRGMAHRLCNAIIGQAGDDPARLRLIAANLEKRLGVMAHG